MIKWNRITRITKICSVGEQTGRQHKKRVKRNNRMTLQRVSAGLRTDEVTEHRCK